MSGARLFFARCRKVARLFFLGPAALTYLWMLQRSGLFDADFYRRSNPGLNRLYRALPMRHYILWGEAAGLRPGAEFDPQAYLDLHPDVARAGLAPLQHFLRLGRAEGRAHRKHAVPRLPRVPKTQWRVDPTARHHPYALHVHIYYPDLWDEFADRLVTLDIGIDLFVTVTWRGEETTWLIDRIRDRFPDAHVFAAANRGRDILPFLKLVNAGAFDGYAAVCKLHTKKSPHREDGDTWRRHLVRGILPDAGVGAPLSRFLADTDAAFWVADGPCYDVHDWWGSNRDKTAAVLRRVELDDLAADLCFPAGSMYWTKPLMIGMIRALRLTDDLFEVEDGQVDGTLAHAVERAVGGLARAAGQNIVQTKQLARPAPLPRAPAYVSAFYLPQFHPIPQNDAWWGTGFTEWRGVAAATSAFPGHLQPARPGALGYYDLRAPEVMQDQAALARTAGVDAFCVYHYWFGGKRLLEKPLDRLLSSPGTEFPFYLCWANESWRRNWDGLSGEILIGQDYAPDFERRLVDSTLPYMRDPRYQRPDGRRPRFIIYRPEDMPAPEQNVARMRRAWKQAGIGAVELGAVCFHVAGESPVPPGVFDFWVEMPPHGLVDGAAYRFGGPLGNTLGANGPAPGFAGLIYDYEAVAARSLSPTYRAGLPPDTIAGIMPGWDNTARRRARAHIARGANPATFRHWLRRLADGPLASSYRGELFVNAWNEWAEKAMLEPTEQFGRLNLDVMAELTRPAQHLTLPDRTGALGNG